MELLKKLIVYIKAHSGKVNKTELSQNVKKKFGLTKDGPVFYLDKDFAIRFCHQSKSSKSLSNTVLALSKLQKYDGIPFIVCFVRPKENRFFITNSTFLKKISHSSEKLRVDNIKGSIVFCSFFHVLTC